MERMRKQVGRIAGGQADAAATPTASTFGAIKAEKPGSRGELQHCHRLFDCDVDQTNRPQAFRHTTCYRTWEPIFGAERSSHGVARQQHASSQSRPVSHSIFRDCDAKQGHWRFSTTAPAACNERLKWLRAQTGRALQFCRKPNTRRMLRECY